MLDVLARPCYVTVMASETRTVILADMRRSRRAGSRADLANRVRGALATVSGEFGEHVQAPLQLTRGLDEASGVLRDAAVSYELCRRVNDLLHPVVFRFAIVRGAIDVNADSRDASLMDGPAFHDAAELLARLKKGDETYAFRIGLPDDLAALLDSTANLAALLIARRTPRQQEIALLNEAAASQKAVAERLGISAQTVSETLQAGAWHATEQARNAINALLKSRVREGEVSDAR